MYDANGDGFITLDEMIAYLTSVFKVVYETQPGTLSRTSGATPDQLAIVTAEQIFIDADLNHDGKLSLDEFIRWYATEGLENGVESEEEDEEEEEEEEEMQGVILSLHDVRRITMLDHYTPDEAFEVLALEGKEGYLDRSSFNRAFDKLVGGKGKVRPTDMELYRHILNRLFTIFDVDGNGIIDFAEIASGVSVLCEGHPADKAKAAFKLYDYNDDGVISLDEMTQYMTCVFRVMYELEEGSKAREANFSPLALAEATAAQVFADADLNGDGKLSFPEFEKWYSGDVGSQVSAPADIAATALDVNEIRRLTKLNQCNASDLFQQFSNVANEDKLIDRDAFNSVFEHVIDFDAARTEDDYIRLSFILDRIFDMFDRDQNGFVDLAELSR